MKPKLSVIILTHNEDKMLEGCLETVKWASEVIVIDKKSTDKTIEIAQKHNARIIKFKGEHFDKWRNLGLKYATNDWLLYIDPDERVTLTLRREIKQIISSNEPQSAAYEVARRNFWWGKEFRYCGAWPDYTTRLFKKANLVKWHGIVHESAVIEGAIGKLTAPLIHFTHRDLLGGLKKSLQFTKLEAKLFAETNHPPITWPRLTKVTLQMFLYKFIKQKGYKEGTEGFIESVAQAMNRFIVYTQVWELQQDPTLSVLYKRLEKKIKKTQ